MSDIVLATGTPTIYIDKPPGCQVIGADPWGDGSDATYTLGYPASNIAGSVENLTDPSAPTDVVLRARVSVTSGGSYSVGDLKLQDFSSGEVIAFFSNATVPADGAIHDTEFRATVDDPGNLAYYVGWLRTATQLMISHSYSGTSGTNMTVYGAVVTVEFASAAPAPLRLYPRSSTRIYPRRSTRRPGTF